MLSSLLGAKAAVAAAIAVVGLGGVATAAYAGALPSSAQRIAHDTIGAPSPHAGNSAHAGSKRHAGHSGTPVGPSASGPAAFGLCTAYRNATKHGKAPLKAVAFRNLEKAAGGAANVANFCASVAHPGAPATRHNRARASHRTGKPGRHRTGRPASHPTGPPSHG